MRIALGGIWESSSEGATIYRCVQPLAAVGDISERALQAIAPCLWLLPGDVSLSGYEDTLSNEWPNSMGDNNLYRPMRILGAFWQVMQKAAVQVNADLVLVDIGPNLDAINRSVLIATDYVVIPLGADLFSLQGLKNLGPTLGSWKALWQKRLDNWANSRESGQYSEFRLPRGLMQPVGHLCQQHGVRLDRPVKAYDKWVNRIPNVYRQAVLNQDIPTADTQAEAPCCLATIRHYRSLVPMGREHRKPIFSLTAADGAIGSHACAVQAAKRDSKALAEKIACQINLPL